MMIFLIQLYGHKYIWRKSWGSQMGDKIWPMHLADVVSFEGSEVVTLWWHQWLGSWS